MPIRLPLVLLVFAAVGIAAASNASDWPQFLGPKRNGTYEGSDLADSWGSNGPTVFWQKQIGHGFSGPVVAEHKLILFHRVANNETIDCLEAESGKAQWSFSYPTGYEDEFGFDDGPRATPTINESRVYTYGAEGMLHCLEFATGKKLWSVNAKKDFQSPNGFFGMACSPLVEGKAVLLNIGGQKGAGIVAFDKTTGAVLWKATDDEASYSSPIAATLDGERSALFLTRNGLVAVDPGSGRVRYQYPWHSRNRTSVNAATPLVFGNTVFLSACYGTGAILLRCQGQNQFEKIWSGDDLLSNHYATSVERNGFLYGIHGRADPGFSPRPKLRCVDLNKREMKWEADSIGAATLILAGERLIILTDKGELIEAPASPDQFRTTCRAQILNSECRPFPALAQGLFYARSKDQLVCLDLRKSPKTNP